MHCAYNGARFHFGRETAPGSSIPKTLSAGQGILGSCRKLGKELEMVGGRDSTWRGEGELLDKEGSRWAGTGGGGGAITSLHRESPDSTQFSQLLHRRYITDEQHSLP